MACPLVSDCRIKLNGRPLTGEKRVALTRVQVDLDVDLIGQCFLTFNDRNLTLINGSDFASGVNVEVALGFDASLRRVFAGDVVALEPQFRRDLPPALL